MRMESREISICVRLFALHHILANNLFFVHKTYPTKLYKTMKYCERGREKITKRGNRIYVGRAILYSTVIILPCNLKNML